jgi:undecaprenyl diphosphate synthase
MDNNVRVLHAGRRFRLPKSVFRELDKTIEMSAANTAMALCLAISYGGRAELIDPITRIAGSVQSGALRPEDIDEDLISRHLYQPGLPFPDLLIRTANELRLSNFLLWQISYAEIWVTDVCWPDFRREHLWQAFESFGKRTRKYGTVIGEHERT